MSRGLSNIYICFMFDLAKLFWGTIRDCEGSHAIIKKWTQQSQTKYYTKLVNTLWCLAELNDETDQIIKKCYLCLSKWPAQAGSAAHRGVQWGTGLRTCEKKQRTITTISNSTLQHGYPTAPSAPDLGSYWGQIIVFLSAHEIDIWEVYCKYFRSPQYQYNAIIICKALWLTYTLFSGKTCMFYTYV